jgi:AGCS family alanine or glycine:cation symporter
MGALDTLFSELVDYAWGMPLIVVLLGGGFALLALSRFLPFLGLWHAIDILRG